MSIVVTQCIYNGMGVPISRGHDISPPRIFLILYATNLRVQRFIHEVRCVLEIGIFSIFTSHIHIIMFNALTPNILVPIYVM